MLFRRPEELFFRDIMSRLRAVHRPRVSHTFTSPTKYLRDRRRRCMKYQAIWVLHRAALQATYSLYSLGEDTVANFLLAYFFIYTRVSSALSVGSCLYEG